MYVRMFVCRCGRRLRRYTKTNNDDDDNNIQQHITYRERDRENRHIKDKMPKQVIVSHSHIIIILYVNEEKNISYRLFSIDQSPEKRRHKLFHKI